MKSHKTLLMTLGLSALLAIPAFATSIDLGINGNALKLA